MSNSKTNIPALLQKLASLDITLYLDKATKLRAKAPKGAITPELSKTIKENKVDLTTYLQKLASMTASQVTQEQIVAVKDKGNKLPLSFAQQRLWFIDQLKQGSPEYNMPIAFKISGVLNLALVKRAFSCIVSRHEILRTNYINDNGTAYQQVKPLSEFNFAIDEMTLSSAQTDSELADIVQRNMYTPFDLSKDLMLRVSYIHTSQASGILILNMHHISSDGWSIEVLIKEFFALYDAFKTGLSDPLPPLNIQYSDYAVWQHEHAPSLDQQFKYWQQQLSDMPLIHGLHREPTPLEDHTRQAQTVSGGLPTDCANKLLKLAKDLNVTPFMLMHGIFSIVMSKHSNSDDIIVGTPIANRSQAQLQPLIGFFVNTLVLRVDTSINMLEEYFAALRKVHLSAQQYQEMPYDQLVDRLKVPRDGGYNPLFQIMFTSNTEYGLNDQQTLNRSALADVDATVFESQSTPAQFELHISLNISDSGVDICWQYDPSIYKQSYIEKLHTHLQVLLESFSNIAHPATTKISDLALLPHTEQAHLINTLNAREIEYSQSHSVCTLFDRQANLNPHSVAVIFEAHSITYKVLNDKATDLAKLLIKNYKLESNKPIGLFAERSIEMVIGMLAILKAGCSYVPMEINSPAQRLAHILQDASPQLILKHSKNDLDIANWHGEICNLSEAISALDNTEIDQDQTLLLPTAPDAQTPAYIIYTSGSTGKPKGVEIPHIGIIRLITNPSFMQLDSSTVMIHTANIAFDAATLEVWGPLLNGGKVILYPDNILTPQQLNATIDKHQVNSMFLTTAFFKEWLLLENRLESLQQLIVGGEALDLATVQLAQKKLTHVQLINAYGPTENTTFTTSHKFKFPLPSKVVPIGKRLHCDEIYILDKYNNLTPHGAIGELCVGGDGLATGYVNKPELTAQKFIANPFVSSRTSDASDRLYRTGDLVRYLPDNTLEYIGRTDDQVKIRGFRIELGEIESKLVEHQKVTSASVITFNSGKTVKLAAYIQLCDTVRSESVDTTLADIKKNLVDKLPSYMVPSAFIVVDSWPMTANGKLNKRALPNPDTHTPAATIPARTATEKDIAKIWAELLGVDATTIGIDANFFELGGHSLLCIRLVAEISQAFSIDISVEQVFNAQNLAHLAQQIDSRNAEESNTIALVPIERTSELLPVSYAQQRMWFMDKLQSGSAEYNMPVAFNIEGDVDFGLLEHAFNEIIRRHEIIRTTYHEQDGEIKQKVRPVELIDFKIEVTDLTAYSTVSQTQKLNEKLDAEFSRPFDLASDLMLRAHIVKLSERKSTLIYNMHHIASDGWSMEVITREFTALYSAYKQAQPSALNDLPIQYADFALWQRAYLDETKLKQQLHYWLDNLRDAPATHSLPLCQPRSQNLTNPAAVVESTLGEQPSAKLMAIAKDAKLTPFMLMHGLLSLIITKHSNSHDIIVGTPTANRLKTELAPLVGLFVNTLVLRVNTEQADWQDFFNHLREVHLNSQKHQDIPFEQLVEHLSESRSTQVTPIFQIMVTINSEFGQMDNAQQSTEEHGDARFELLTAQQGLAKFDLEVDFVICESGIKVHWQYNSSLFTQQRIQKMSDHLCTLMENLSASYTDLKDAPPLTLPAYSREEENQLLRLSHGVSRAFNDNQCIHELIEQMAHERPDKVALINGDTQLTYAQINAQANQLARYIMNDFDVSAETVVGLCADRSVEMVIGAIAILKTGGGFVPIDPAYPLPRIEYMLDDAQLKLVLTQGNGNKALSQSSVDKIDLDRVVNQTGVLSTYTTENITKDQLSLCASSTAYIIYTSGSTGQPKGVMVAHSALLNYQEHIKTVYQVSDNDVVLQFSNISFDIFIEELCASLCIGAQLVLRNEQSAYSFDHFIQFCNQHNITIASLPTAFWAQTTSGELAVPVHSLQKVIVGGEALTATTVKNHYQKLGNGTSLINTYGPTEATVTASSYVTSPKDAQAHNIPIGKANPNYQLLVLDPYLSPTPLGSIGEIYIGGPGLAKGYWQRLDLTKEKFVVNPYHDPQHKQSSELLYRTGDLGYLLEDGTVHFVGRQDSQVKIRGFRVELGEIESQIAQIPEIDSVLVNITELNHNQYLVAYVKAESQIVTANSTELEQTIQQSLKAALPDYMQPHKIVIVSEWPLTANGKIDKNALPAISFEISAQQHEAPSTEAEIALTKIWADVLDTHIDTLSIGSSFFEIGGHSLLAVKLISKIHTVLQKPVSLSQVFEFNTIKTQAELIDSLRSTHLWDQPLLQLTRKVAAPAIGCYFIPGVASTDKDFIDIMQHMNEFEGEVGVFRHRGLISGEKPFTSITENVEAFIDAITARNLNKVKLVGHSYGGVLALELAARLIDSGYQVELTMLDTYIHPARFVDAATLNENIDSIEVAEHLKSLYNLQSRLHIEYQPNWSLGHTQLVLATQSPADQNKYIAYLDRHASQISTSKLPGDHFSILLGDNAKHIAKEILNSNSF
ncbi:non-ribosomal peptide synthetase [Pseudoalteromonas luteoviolacea]|uniref:Amino acid adenylation domain/amino acid adenylation domain protein n=1 Tax=Pseudoalteromonas luteoviolacea (strain 2ta16) TaxID=1353533 RepID=V4HSY1_PSEL2|nr:non-ribosomal peptide synthetase [Pseudoalteromonas luteoviolacea]ESP93915.1 amino acid adenylation domain/amino acid adenylation domain protein [Pseudoalteromonas luteoviolacea 2ta16]KZN31348.1 hypothetical protein N483_05865 [Pseudoalteromonas luteoviolacea NCIMB 1944]